MEQPVIKASGLKKSFGTLIAVDDLDLVAHSGTCLGLLGPNGAGKTTTIEMLEGLSRPDSGTIQLMGLDWQTDGDAIRERIGVQLQETSMQDKLTVRETLQLFMSFYKNTRSLDEIVSLVGLQEKLGDRVVNLSGGQQQRLALGCALVNKPQVLFLDEPTTGLDPQARRRVWEIVEEFKAEGGTVLLTTHYMDEAEKLADDLAIIDHGRAIARGAPAEIIASLGAESIVEFQLSSEEDSRRLSIEQLTGLDSVLEAGQIGSVVTLRVRDTKRALTALLSWLERENINALDVRTHRPTLEDVFVSLTGKHLRDN